MKNRGGKTFEEVFEGYPRKFIELYKIRQAEQGNAGKVPEHESAGINFGGFQWSITKEGSSAWAQAVHHKKFSLLFKKLTYEIC